jgi:pilus assembly protein Flp/PilA
MMTRMKRLYWDERGAVATEYVMLVVFIVLAIVAGVSLLGNALNTIFSAVGSLVSSAANNLP